MVRFFLSVPAAEGTFSTVSESVGFCLATMPEEKFCFGLCLSAGSLWHKIPCEHGCEGEKADASFATNASIIAQKR